MQEVVLYGAKAAGRKALVDDGDYELAMTQRWTLRDQHGCLYAIANVKRNGIWGGTMFMHNLIMGQLGIDHIDGNGLNNQRSNLRVATAVENARNRRPNRSARSPYKGVDYHEHTGKWRARIRGRYIGLYPTQEEAAAGYDVAAAELFGEFAHLNFPAQRRLACQLRSYTALMSYPGVFLYWTAIAPTT